MVPKVEDKMGSSFQTNAARFAPTLPDSGLVKGPSWIDNPEPGAHYKPILWNDLKTNDKTLLKYKQFQHKPQTVIPTARPPAIPGKKLAQTAYSGNGTDVVGPAAYNP